MIYVHFQNSLWLHHIWKAGPVGLAGSPSLYSSVVQRTLFTQRILTWRSKLTSADLFRKRA